MTTNDLVKTDKKKDFEPDILDSLPVISEPRCRICRSDFRPLIDRMIVGPYTYAAIARQFADKDQYLGGNHEALRKSIERHAKTHVTVRDQAIREIIEQRAVERGLLVEDQKSLIQTTEALLELYIQKGYEQITKDGTWVRHQDILEAVKMVEEMRKDTIGEQVEFLKKQVSVISQAVREVVPPDLHPAIVDRAHELMTNPIIDVVVPSKVKELETTNVA